MVGVIRRKLLQRIMVKSVPIEDGPFCTFTCGSVQETEGCDVWRIRIKSFVKLYWSLKQTLILLSDHGIDNWCSTSGQRGCVILPAGFPMGLGI